jgi:hypothetical protein
MMHSFWSSRIFREECRIWGVSVRTHAHTPNAGSYHGDSPRAFIFQPGPRKNQGRQAGKEKPSPQPRRKRGQRVNLPLNSIVKSLISY